MCLDIIVCRKILIQIKRPTHYYENNYIIMYTQLSVNLTVIATAALELIPMYSNIVYMCSILITYIH